MIIKPSTRFHWLFLLTALVSVLVLLHLKLSTQVRQIVSFARGVAFYRASAYGDAEIHFRLIPIKPARLGPVRYNLGNALYQQGRYPEAQACYVSATHDSNGQFRAYAWANLGQLYYRTQRLSSAYTAYRNALLLASSDNDIRQDFLFIRHKLLARTIRPAPVPPAASTTQQQPNGTGTPSPKGPQQPPPPKPSDQLSNRDIQNIMGLINESENRVRDKMNDSRQRGRKPESDEQDY